MKTTDSYTYECTNEECGWTGSHDERAERLGRFDGIVACVCPECGNDEFFRHEQAIHLAGFLWVALLLLLPLLTAAQAEIRRDTAYTAWESIAHHAPADTPHRAWEVETIFAERVPTSSGVLYIHDQIRTCRLSGTVESRQMRVLAYRKREEITANQ